MTKVFFNKFVKYKDTRYTPYAPITIDNADLATLVKEGAFILSKTEEKKPEPVASIEEIPEVEEIVPEEITPEEIIEPVKHKKAKKEKSEEE